MKNGESYEGDTGTYRTPIYVEHLTEGIMQLVSNYHPGTFHLAGTDWMNMYQFGRAVAEVFDLDSSLVNPVQVSAGLPTEKAPPEELEQCLRPDILGLDCTQTNQRLGLRCFSAVTGLQEMLV